MKITPGGRRLWPLPSAATLARRGDRARPEGLGRLAGQARPEGQAQPGDDLGYGAQPSAATDRATSGPGTQELVIVVEDFAYTLPDAVPAGRKPAT